MYPLYTNNYTAATCYSLARDLLHHMHNINGAQLNSHQRAADLKISIAVELLMLAAIDSAADATEKINIMLNVATAENCLDDAAAELKAAVELGQAHPSESLGVVLRGLEATLAAVHTLAAELGKKEAQS